MDPRIPRDRGARRAGPVLPPRARADARSRDDLRKTSELVERLRRLDGEPFAQYRRIVGRHALGEFEVWVDRVPPDPFAGPAQVRVVADRDKSSIPSDLVDLPARRLGAEDHLCREAQRTLEQLGFGEPKIPGRAHVALEPFGPAIVERCGCRITLRHIELRLLVDLPESARRIRARQAEELFRETLLRVATSVLLFSARRTEQARCAADNVEDHVALKQELGRRGLVAFVGDGARLARAGGTDEGPRHDGRDVAFVSPEALRVTLPTPHAGPLTGMGVPAGVTLIVGGGFHGKSTLLDAIARGVHPHHEGDGRERVASLGEAVVIRAEDGRAVRRTDISAFLGDLPSGVLASEFTTEDASGSTSQAASTIEALESGARLLLIDEDSAAANLMVRDGRMQRLVPRPGEPIVPFLDRVRELYDRFGVSTLLVTGGSGDYLEVADRVIRMEAFRAHDVTHEAREIVGATRSMRLREALPPWEPAAPRVAWVDAGRQPDHRRALLRGPRAVQIGEETVDLGALEQLVEAAQVRALGLLMAAAAKRLDGKRSVIDVVRELDLWLSREGLDALDPPVAYDLARPRSFEIAAAMNRWRALRVRRGGETGPS